MFAGAVLTENQEKKGQSMMVSSARHRRGHSPEHPPTCPRSWRRRATALLVAMATLMCGLITSGRLARAVEPAIAGVTASGAAADGHAAAAAVDGDPATYWQSPADSSMQDYRRFLDFDLHGTYSISQIDITNLTGSYYHYEVYLSKDGADYGKVAYKSDDAPASGAADTHPMMPPKPHTRASASATTPPPSRSTSPKSLSTAPRSPTSRPAPRPSPSPTSTQARGAGSGPA